MITETSDGLPSRVLRDLLSSTTAPARLDGMQEGSEDNPFVLWIIEKLMPQTYVQLGLDDGEVSFEKALAGLPDKSIDLLRIHGQSATTVPSGRDLELCLSKLSDRAVVLLPPTGFEEQRAYSQWLRALPRGASDASPFFDSGYGIGMLSIGREVPDVIQRLTHLQGDDVTLVQLAFQSFGRLLASQLSESILRREAKKAAEALLLESSKLDSARDQLWKAEIERRKLEVESCRAEVHLAERVAILRHTNAEKDRLIAGLQNEKQAMGIEITELRKAHDTVMHSRSMAVTKPMRVLIDIVRRVVR
jgi:hypothetical protein